MRDEPVFGILTEQYDISYPQYYDITRKYGHFSEDGAQYTVTDRNTPRQWYSVMANKNFASIMTNDGYGVFGYKSFYLRFSKFYSKTDYMIRQLNGKRRIIIKNSTGKTYDLIGDSADLQFEVRPGSCKYSGTVDNIQFEILMYVPENDPIECTKVTLSGLHGYNWTIHTVQDWSITCALPKTKDYTMSMSTEKDCVVMTGEDVHTWGNLYGFTAQQGLTACVESYQEPVNSDNSKIQNFYRVTTTKELQAKSNCVEYIYTGVSDNSYCQLVKKYLENQQFEAEFEKLNRKWDNIIQRNYCQLPDKNLQNFLNVWLKNQLHITSLYNRFGRMGYRDILQDCWGALYVDPELTRNHIKEAAARMYPDGRCPRQFDLYSDIFDVRDFADSPIWMPIALNYYLKETGDFDLLNEAVGYYGCDEVTTVREHIERALEYLFTNRGKNGLVLIRGGDWLDGLEGLNKLGEATGVWMTIAAFHAQNLMAEIYDQIGDQETADLMRRRSAEYKHYVNTVGWNGKWYSYAIINDNEIIGGPDCLEGKIYLNPQTWAIFTGIADGDKYDKLMRAINVYLTTPVGPLLMAPPYVATGHRYGRLQKQRPGTFANSAVYLHAASFKIFADVKRGAYNEAYDTFMRIIPNHVDNPDSRRTNEPYAVGNVHYGTAHQCTGLNLYSWFSATPAWLIHGGFEEILGIHPEFNGLRISPPDIDGWDSFQIRRTYRETVYNFSFKRTGKRAIYVDNKLISENVVYSTKPEVQVTVEF